MSFVIEFISIDSDSLRQPEKIIEIYDYWFEILRLFIFTLSEKKRKKYIELLTEELNFEFFEKYRNEDFDGLEEFAFWLEIVFISLIHLQMNKIQQA